jgi:hypothetical protein
MNQASADPSRFGYGDCIMWPFRSGQWLPHVILMSLIALIPFVGSMALAGWVLTAADSLHQGRPSVPPAGFYLRRGARLYFVAFVWGTIAVAMLYMAMFGFMAAFLQPRSLGGSGFYFAFVGWFAFVFGFGVVTHLAFLFIVPGAIEADARGALRGLNPANAIIDVVRHPKESLFAALVTYVGWIIAGLGGSLCYVGIILTLGYGALVFAGALYVYERNIAVRPA